MRTVLVRAATAAAMLVAVFPAFAVDDLDDDCKWCPSWRSDRSDRPPSLLARFAVWSERAAKRARVTRSTGRFKSAPEDGRASRWIAPLRARSESSRVDDPRPRSLQ